MRISHRVPVAARLNRFSYAIRNIVAEAQRVEASGRRVRYLNIGDPVAFGFNTPPHLIDAVERALRDGHNGYGPSPGSPRHGRPSPPNTRRAVFRLTPDRVFLTAGTSEGIELALGALVDEGSEVLVPMPTYPLYTAVLAKLGARALFYRTDPDRGWMPDLDHLRSLVTPATRALVVIDPNNPTGASYSDRDPAGARSTSPTVTAWRSSPTRFTAIWDSTVPSRRLAASIPTRRSFLSRACRRPISRLAGVRAGWLSAVRRA